MDKNTCWYKNELIVQEMNKNYPVYLKLMDETQHIGALSSIIHDLHLSNKKYNVVDIGCGTAQISILFQLYKNSFTYTGADLPHIIDGCSKKWHPENLYLYFDINKNTVDFIDQYDVVLLNAFIDVMENPLEVLDKILAKAQKYVILHRQEMTTSKSTHVVKNDSYGGYTYHSVINEYDFGELMKKHKFVIVKENTCGFANWENGGHSLLLKKI